MKISIKKRDSTTGKVKLTCKDVHGAIRDYILTKSGLSDDELPKHLFIEAIAHGSQSQDIITFDGPNDTCVDMEVSW